LKLCGDYPQITQIAQIKTTNKSLAYTKHEGFCNFESKLTDYCATRRGPGRDLVREYVDAARAEGLRFGFYYSLNEIKRAEKPREGKY
jgi:alpha-L-fucosidase